MTGSLYWARAGDPADPHDRFRLVFSGKRELRLHDPRRFGLVQAVRLDRPGGEPGLFAGLGPEPLGRAFTGDYLFRLFRGRKAPVKSLIMDQRVVVGVGNIYASEGLFRAGIRPGRGAGRLTRSECGRLVEALTRVLGEAIRAGGTSMADYAVNGRKGRFRTRLQVYGRKDEPCLRTGCPGRVRRRVVGGRSSFYCPECQK
jgi:formamidopyrimidine-DNA glycosylase